MIRKKHAEQIRRGIRIARINLSIERTYRAHIRRSDSDIAKRLLTGLIQDKTDPKFLRSRPDSFHPKLVGKTFREYCKRHKDEGQL